MTEEKNIADRFVEIAQGAAEDTTGFFEVSGPGDGNRKTNEFMKELRSRVEKELCGGLAEQRICGDNKLAVDFYFPNEATIIEVALSLKNSNTEFEKDILKALMAKQEHQPVDKLLFLSKPGANKRHESPSSRAIIEWVKCNHQIQIEIRELINK